MSLAGEGNRRFNLHRILLIQRRIMELIARLNDAEFPGAPHAASHSDDGADEVNVTALGGFPGGGTTFLRDDATFAAVTAGAHATSHQNGGSDEINVAGLSGLLADDQNPVNHATDHQNGGGDEINVGGLSGVLADPQTVDTDPAGALDGDGSVGSPLGVRVDGVTIIINGSNELEVVDGGSPGGSPGGDLSGTHYPFKFGAQMSDGSVIATGLHRFTARIPPDGDGEIVAWHLRSEQTTNLEIDVLKNGVSITDGNNPELSGAQNASDTNLSDWDDVTVIEDDIITIDVLVNSASELYELQFSVVRS